MYLSRDDDTTTILTQMLSTGRTHDVQGGSAPREAIAYVVIKVGSFSYPTALQPAEHFINLSTIYSLRGTEPPWRFMGMWVGVVARM